MNMNLTYEMLIRNAHNCDRYGVPGADTDLYNSLDFESDDFESGVQLGQVISSIRYAAHEMVNSGNYTQNEIDTITELEDDGLIEPSRDELNKIVTKLFEFSKRMIRK